MKDFIYMFTEDWLGRFIGLFLLFCVGSLVLVIGYFIYFAVNCQSSHEGTPYYHAPTYVMSGKIIIPVGGGYYGDTICDRWK